MKFTPATNCRSASSTLPRDALRIQATPSPIAFIIPALREEAAIAPRLDGLCALLDAAACTDAGTSLLDEGARVLEIPVSYRKRIALDSAISGNLLGTIRPRCKILWTFTK